MTVASRLRLGRLCSCPGGRHGRLYGLALAFGNAFAGLHRRSQALQRVADQPRDRRLRDALAPRDLGLAEVLLVAHPQHPPVALGQLRRARRRAAGATRRRARAAGTCASSSAIAAAGPPSSASDDLVVRRAERAGELVDRRLASQLGGHPRLLGTRAGRELVQRLRLAHERGAVAQVMLDLALDRRAPRASRSGSPRAGSKRSTALIRPIVPTWTRSSSGSPRRWNRRATDSTSGRLRSINSALVGSPPEPDRTARSPRSQ